jgi:hypothetical protein
MAFENQVENTQTQMGTQAQKLYNEVEAAYMQAGGGTAGAQAADQELIQIAKSGAIDQLSLGDQQALGQAISNGTDGNLLVQLENSQKGAGGSDYWVGGAGINQDLAWNGGVTQSNEAWTPEAAQAALFGVNDDATTTAAAGSDSSSGGGGGGGW